MPGKVLPARDGSEVVLKSAWGETGTDTNTKRSLCRTESVQTEPNPNSLVSVVSR
jgi:hypothetical protein